MCRNPSMHEYCSCRFKFVCVVLSVCPCVWLIYFTNYRNSVNCGVPPSLAACVSAWPRTVGMLSAEPKPELEMAAKPSIGLVVFRLADEQELRSSPVYRELPSAFVGILPIMLP